MRIYKETYKIKLILKGGLMKKSIIVMLLIVSCISLAAKKNKQEVEVPNMEVQMEKADKIENYRAKKDVAWHKTEYNKVLKYLNKSKKQEVE